MASACSDYRGCNCGQPASLELLQVTSSGVGSNILMADNNHTLYSSVNVRIVYVATQGGNFEENVKYCV